MIDANLVAFLTNATAAGDRVHTGSPPQNSPKPYLVLQRTDGTAPRVLSGRALFPRARFTVIAVSRDKAAALQLANEVNARLTAKARYEMAGRSSATSVKDCRRASGPTDVTVIDGDAEFHGYAQEFAFMYLDS